MTHLRLCARVAALASLLATLAAATAAVAAPNVPSAPARPVEAPEPAAAANPRFPMPGEQFLRHVERRIERVTERIDTAIERRKLPPQLAREIRTDLTQGARRVRAAAGQAASDGQVTLDEAQGVRAVVRELRAQARAKFGERVKKHPPGGTPRGRGGK